MILCMMPPAVVIQQPLDVTKDVLDVIYQSALEVELAEVCIGEAGYSENRKHKRCEGQQLDVQLFVCPESVRV